MILCCPIPKHRSLNIINGIVGLTFSCDGSHYIPADEFLSEGYKF